MLRKRAVAAFLAVAAVCSGNAAAQTTTTVFSTDFESGLPAQLTPPGCQLYGVQGWSGLGPVGYQFGGSFLGYTVVLR